MNRWHMHSRQRKLLISILLLVFIMTHSPTFITNAGSMENSVSTGNMINQITGGDIPGVSDNTISDSDIPNDNTDGTANNNVSDSKPNTEPDISTDTDLPAEGSGTISAGDLQQETPTTAVTVQQIELLFENTFNIEELQVGNFESLFTIRPIPITDNDEVTQPLVSLYYGYDGPDFCTEVSSESGLSISIPYEYYGSFYCYGMDQQGNCSNIISTQVLIDGTMPEISWEEIAINDSKYLRITAQESGSFISGLATASCSANDAILEYANYNIASEITNICGQNVMETVFFDIPVDGLEESILEIVITDNAGNEAKAMLNLEDILSAEPLILSVNIPSNIHLFVDPNNPHKQIQSEVLTITNYSECDIYFKFTKVTIEVNRDNVPDNPDAKDCNMYLETDEGERYDLPVGNTKDVCVIKIPGTASAGDNTFSFTVDGYVDNTSDEYWRDGDISISMLVSFWGAEAEETIPPHQ